MKATGLLVAIASASLIVLVGTVMLGRTVFSGSPGSRPDRQIGSQAAGSAVSQRPARWTPPRNPNGYAVTEEMLPYDSRVARFANFPVLLPTHEPEGVHLSTATLHFDPDTGKRLLQFTLKGPYQGLISEEWLAGPDPTYPDGLHITTVRDASGATFRNLQSDVRGVAVSIAFNASLPDDELISLCQSLREIEPVHAASR